MSASSRLSALSGMLLLGVYFILAASPVNAQSGAALTMDICPDDLNGIPRGTPSLTCGCSSDEASNRRAIYGDNPYNMVVSAAAVCRAAVHAGAITLDGGPITVTFEPEATFFPATTRNSVSSTSTDRAGGFRVAVQERITSPASNNSPTVDAEGQPIQAPIAETLKAAGRVQLYINFATNEDRPLPLSEPVLQELLKVLKDDPGLNVELVGHTDSQGSADHNLDLSQRRAASVHFWLIQNGVGIARLRSDGRGFLEPIADNSTDSGRALNRRVEVKAVD